MAIWIEGWTGDVATVVDGRRPNRILIAITSTDGTIPHGFFQKATIRGFPEFPEIVVTCLTPDAREAIVTSVENLKGALVWSLEVAQLDEGDGKKPWKSCVMLFSVLIRASGGIGNQASTMATAVIDGSVKVVTPLVPDPPDLGGD